MDNKEKTNEESVDFSKERSNQVYEMIKKERTKLGMRCDTLVLTDRDLRPELRDKSININKLNFDDFMFNSMREVQIEDMIMYCGIAGTKILKSRYGHCGIVK